MHLRKLLLITLLISTPLLFVGLKMSDFKASLVEFSMSIAPAEEPEEEEEESSGGGSSGGGGGSGNGSSNEVTNTNPDSEEETVESEEETIATTEDEQVEDETSIPVETEEPIQPDTSSASTPSSIVDASETTSISVPKEGLSSANSGDFQPKETESAEILKPAENPPEIVPSKVATPEAEHSVETTVEAKKSPFVAALDDLKTVVWNALEEVVKTVVRVVNSIVKWFIDFFTIAVFSLIW